MRNVEIDKDSYPYGEMQQGDEVFAVYMPTLEKVFPHGMPRKLVHMLCKALNRPHHAGQADTVKGVVLDPIKMAFVLLERAKVAWDADIITDAEFFKVRDKCMQEVCVPVLHELTSGARG